MKFIRLVVGFVLRFLNWVTLPKKGQRDPEAQKKIELELEKFHLYEFPACPFCLKVQRAFVKLNLPVKSRNAKNDPYRTELLKQGGKLMAPCLKIEENGQVQWLYESSDIIHYMTKKYPLSQS